MLSVRNLSSSFGKSLVLDNVSFELQSGDILAVAGPSGCGKSTLLNILGGIIKQYSGEIRMNGNIPGTSDIRCGYVPQTLGLLPWKKVKDNIFLPYQIDKSLTMDKDDTEKIIAELGIAELLNRYPSQLSGGQRQRAALARAFIAHPDLLLMDEPFSALDTLTADTSRNLFFEIWKKHRATTILTTHNLEEAATLGKYVLLLGKLPARVKHWIENPFFDQKEKEESQDFHRFVRKLKALTRENDTLEGR